MLIKEVEVLKQDGTHTLHLEFKKKFPVYFVQHDPRCPVEIWQILTTAVEFICSRKYAKQLPSSSAIGGPGSVVRIIFLIPRKLSNGGEITNDEPSTSRQSRRQQQEHIGQQKFDVISVLRKLQTVLASPKVEYSVNEEPLISSTLDAFQLKFLTNVDYILPNLSRLQSGGTIPIGHWSRFLDTSLSKQFHNQYECIADLLEKFMKLFQRNSKKYTEHILNKLTTSCLLAASALTIARKTNMCLILKDVRRIFEYISAMEYTVWFLIPNGGTARDVSEMNSDVLDIENITTHIQLRSAQPHRRLYQWTNVQHELQDLLIVAFQLAFAAHCNQRIIFLQNLQRLANYQSFQMALATSCIPPATDVTNSRNMELLYSKNYIQRMIDACIQIGLTVIIEYPSVLPVPATRANIIKCQEDINSEEDDPIWTLVCSDTTQ